MMPASTPSVETPVETKSVVLPIRRTGTRAMPAGVRILEWLVESGLAHRSADPRGVFRFSAAAAGEHAAHPHFRYEDCGRAFCLDTAAPAAPSLPEGFSLSRSELDLRGRRAECAGACR